MVLTKQTYNNQDKYKKPQKLNLTKPQSNPGLVASYDIQPVTDQAYSN